MPVGVVKAFLDIKVWKDVKGYKVLNTYWQTEEGQGVIYGVWLNTYTDRYETADKYQDVSTLSVGNWYELILMTNPKGFLRLQSIKAV